MKSVCSKGLALLLAVVLVLALGGCGNGKGYLPSQKATWGELCRHFQPEWFDSLPNEVQEEYDQILLKEAPHKDTENNEARLVAVTEVKKITDGQEKQKEYPVLALNSCRLYDTKNTESVGTVDLALMLLMQDNKMDFSSSVAVVSDEQPCKLTMVVALSDAGTGKYLAAQAGNFSVLNDVDGIVDSFEKLESGHDYTVQAIVVDQSENYDLADQALYLTKTVTTK